MTTMKVLMAGAALLTAQSLAAAPPVSAVLAHEITEQGTDGVTRTTRFQERFIREGEQLWIERVLPAWAQDEGTARKVRLEQDHNELDVHTAPRYVHATSAGGARLLLVDPKRRATFSAGPEDYAHLGFSGRWTAESHLIDPAALRTMKVSVRATQIAGARWFETKTVSDYTRILWSETLQFPLAIETGALDGRYQSRTTVRLDTGKNPRRPWTQVKDYAAREISDLGD